MNNSTCKPGGEEVLLSNHAGKPHHRKQLHKSILSLHILPPCEEEISPKCSSKMYNNLTQWWYSWLTKCSTKQHPPKTDQTRHYYQGTVTMVYFHYISITPVMFLSNHNQHQFYKRSKLAHTRIQPCGIFQIKNRNLGSKPPIWTGSYRCQCRKK